jgi:hypothetical protein
VTFRQNCHINISCIRKREKDKKRITFTDIMPLYLTYQKDKDFKLKVWLCLSIRKAISRAKISLVKDLRNILSDYFFGAIKASNQGKKEKRKGMLDCTVAINVSFPNGNNNSDYKVEVILNFGISINIYTNIYPCVN